MILHKTLLVNETIEELNVDVTGLFPTCIEWYVVWPCIYMEVLGELPRHQTEKSPSLCRASPFPYQNPPTAAASRLSCPCGQCQQRHGSAAAASGLCDGRTSCRLSDSPPTVCHNRKSQTSLVPSLADRVNAQRRLHISGTEPPPPRAVAVCGTR